ncbi:alpha/beta fold hydrolase [Halomonas sp. WWR20]
MQQDIKRNIILRNNVKVTGHGTQVMIFAAGFGCDQNMWRFVAPSFADDYRVVLFDYVGAGASDVEAYDIQKYADLHGYAQDVLDVLAALDANKVIFVGHSVGCIIGLLASIQEPERFERIIMIGPSPCYLSEASGYQGGFERDSLEGLLEMMEKNKVGWAGFLAPVIMRNSERPALTQELEESFCATDPAIARNFAKVTFFSDNRDDLPKATAPALVLQSSEDTIAPVAVGEYVHQHMPQSTFKLLKATGHCPHMSHPQEIIDLMREYLPGRPPSAAGRLSEQWQLPCGFLSFNLDGKILALNDKLLQWLGYRGEEVQGRSVDSILTASSILFYQMYFFQMIRLHGKAEKIHLTLLSKEGVEIPVLINSECHNFEDRLIIEWMILNNAV